MHFFQRSRLPDAHWWKLTVMQPVRLRKNKLMSLFIAQGDCFLLDAHLLVSALEDFWA